MRHILLATVGMMAAVMAPGALSAQSDTMTPAAAITMTAEQQAMMSGWPADKQASFKTWPADYQTYFWTLTPAQQGGYWVLTNEQRGQLQKMTPQQRIATWQSIQAQMAGQPAPSAETAMPQSTAGAGAMPANDAAAPMAPSAPMATAVPPASPEAMNKSYPLCSKTVTDGCQNRGEGGAPGVSRASDTRGGPPAYPQHSTMRHHKRHR